MRWFLQKGAAIYANENILKYLFHWKFETNAPIFVINLARVERIQKVEIKISLKFNGNNQIEVNSIKNKKIL